MKLSLALYWLSHQGEVFGILVLDMWCCESGRKLKLREGVDQEHSTALPAVVPRFAAEALRLQALSGGTARIQLQLSCCTYMLDCPSIVIISPFSPSLLQVPRQHDRATPKPTITTPHGLKLHQPSTSPAGSAALENKMDQRAAPEFILEAFADPTSVRDVVRGILHTIFFNRFFPAILPQTRDVLDLTLPHVADVELETMIDQRTAALMRQLDADRNQPHHHSQHSNNGSGRGQIGVQFYERRRRKTSGWYPMRGGEEEVCWESWTVKVTVAEPRTESGESLFFPCDYP